MLEKQTLAIALNSPMDTKVDEKLTNQEVFLLQKNARFEKIGSLKKRTGYSRKYPTSILATYSSINTRKIFSDSDNLVFIPEAGTILPYAYRQSTDNFIFAESNYVPCEVSGKVYASLPSGSINCDSDYIDGLRATIYFDAGDTSTLGLYLDLYDEKTTLTTSKLIDQSTSGKGVVRFFKGPSDENLLCVAYNDATASTGRYFVYDLDLAQKNTGTFTAFTSTAAFAADKYNPYCIIACKSTANSIKIIKVKVSGAADQYNFTTAANIKTSSSIDIRIIGDVVYCAYVSDSSSAVMRFFSYNVSISTTVNADRILDSSSVDASKVTFDFISTDVIGFFYSVGYNAAINEPATYYSQHTISTSTSLPMRPRYGLTSYSRCKKLGVINDGKSTLIVNSSDVGIRIYSGLSDPLNFGSMYLLSCNYNEGGGIAVLTRYNTAVVPLISFNPVAVNNNLILVENGLYESSSLRSIAFLGGVTLNEVAAVYSARFDFRTTTYQKNFITKYSKNMFISSGYLQEYCSGLLNEAGFFHSPSIKAVTSNAGTGIALGTYKFVVVYEYTDSKGQVNQSAPTDSATLVLAGAVSSIDVNCISYLGFKGSFIKNPVAVVVYMTIAGGSTYYRMGQQPSASYATVFTTVRISSVPTQNEQLLYTTGGVLPNDPPPPFNFICSHQERLYGIDADFSDQISYTKKSSINASCEFSDFQKISLAASGIKRKNDITGLASLNEKLIIFRRASIYYIVGDGPNVLGEQNNFTEPELISNDLGCIEPQSIISSPSGVFFKSEKGIYLLDGSLGGKYIGSPVEAYNNMEIISSLLVEEENLVMFKTTTNILVYDYLLDRWSIDEVSGIDLGIFDKKTIVLQTGNNILFEDVAFSDNLNGVVTGISLYLETGWIKTSGIQDFSRISNALILGKYISEHTLYVDVYIDYNEINYTRYELTHNTEQSVYQFKIQLKNQKCQSIKFKIYDVPVNGGESCELTNLTLQLGIKKGTYKTQKTRNY